MKIVAALVAALVLSGCATQQWRPVIDHASEAPTVSQQFVSDDVQCSQIARQNVPSAGSAAVDGALAGGLLGAALGAAVGAVLGVPGEGAAFGAAMGGFQGGAQNAVAAEGGYRQIYSNCMRGRGHNVLN